MAKQGGPKQASKGIELEAGPQGADRRNICFLTLPFWIPLGGLNSHWLSLLGRGETKMAIDPTHTSEKMNLSSEQQFLDNRNLDEINGGKAASKVAYHRY